VEPGERVRDGRVASAWARIRLLPRPVFFLAFLLFLSALVPGVAGLVAAVQPDGASLLGALAQHQALVTALSLGAAVGAVLLVERPRTRSLAAYARQLRDHFAKVQADFDGALRRRSGGEGEERHAPEANPPDS